MREIRPGRWECRVYDGLDPNTGKSRYISRTVDATSRRGAQKAANELAREREAERHVGEDETFGEFLDRWFAGKKLNLSGGGDTYETMIRVWLKPSLGARMLRSLTTRDLDQMYAGAQEHGLAPASVGKLHTVARSALGDALRWELIDRNPAATAKPPPIPSPKTRIPEPEELAKLLDAEDPAWMTFLYLATTAGARRGEMCALRWSDLVGDQLTIRQSLTVKGVFKDPKSGRERRLKLDQQTVEALRHHRTRSEEIAATCGCALTDHSFVFSQVPGNSVPLKPGSVTQRFRRMARRLEIDGVRLHDLRALMASWLINHGHDPQTVANRTGHEHTSVLFDSYTHRMDRGAQEAADAIGDFVSEIAKSRLPTAGVPQLEST